MDNLKLKQEISAKDITINKVHFRTEVSSLVSGTLECDDSFEIEDFLPEIDYFDEDKFNMEEFNYYGHQHDDCTISSVDVTINLQGYKPIEINNISIYEQPHMFNNLEFLEKIAEVINEEQEWIKKKEANGDYKQLAINFFQQYPTA